MLYRVFVGFSLCVLLVFHTWLWSSKLVYKARLQYIEYLHIVQSCFPVIFQLEISWWELLCALCCRCIISCTMYKNTCCCNSCYEIPLLLLDMLLVKKCCHSSFNHVSMNCYRNSFWWNALVDIWYWLVQYLFDCNSWKQFHTYPW